MRGHTVCKDATEEEIKLAAMNWLKTAGDRSGGRREREKKKEKKDQEAAQATGSINENRVVHEDRDTVEQ